MTRSGVAEGHRPADPAGVRGDAVSTVNLLYHVPQAERVARGRQPQAPGAGDVAPAEHARVPAAEGRPRRRAARDRGARAQPRRHRRRADRRPATASSPRRGAPGSGGRSPRCCRSSTSSRRRGAIRERRAGIDARRRRQLAARLRRHAARRRQRRAAAVAHRQPVPRLRPRRATRPRRARRWSSSRCYWAGWVTALALAMWLVVPLPADAPHGAAGACGRAARGRQPRRCAAACAAPTSSAGSAARSMRWRCEVAETQTPAARRHRRARARAARAARLGGELPRDLRCGRGRDLRPRHRDRRDRRRQPEGVQHVRLHARRVPARSTSARSAAACGRSRAKMRWRLSRAPSPASSCASNGTAATRTARCAGTKCSASA